MTLCRVIEMPKYVADRIERTEGTSCWLWTGATAHGYGATTMNYVRRYAHRVVYELFCGPIDGLVLHHTCDHKLCVNPDHLVATTQAEHVAVHHRRTHCPRGHAFTPENTYVRPDGWGRQCRTCIKRRTNAGRKERKQ